MDSVHRVKLVLSMQWPRYTEAMAASSGMETCVAHTMAPACRSRGFTIGSSNLIMCIQCAGIPELFFLSILFGSMLPVSTNRGNKQKEKHATKPQNFQTIHSVFCFLIALVGAVCLFSIIVCMPTRTPNGFSSTVMASWISVRIDSSLTWGEYL